MNTYTVLSRLMNGEIEARSVNANLPHLAEHARRQFCSLPEHHVAEILDITFGPPIPYVVCVQWDPALGVPEDNHGDGCDGPLHCACGPYGRLVLDGADERQALIHAAAIRPDAVEYLWAEVAVPVHVHVDSVSRDCDGRMDRHHTEALPEIPRASHREDDPSPRERLGAFVSDRIRGLLMYGIEFSIAQHGSDVIVVDQPSDEGGSSTAYTLCEDDLCDEFGKSSQRDYFAEAMGY